MFLHVKETFKRNIGIVQIFPFHSQNRAQVINRKTVNVHSSFHISRDFLQLLSENMYFKAFGFEV